jgi:hypothetical protein
MNLLGSQKVILARNKVKLLSEPPVGRVGLSRTRDGRRLTVLIFGIERAATGPIRDGLV